MSDTFNNNDYKVLGVEPGADEKEVARSYHRMKAIYSEGSLSTYSLLADDERQEMLDKIEKAYMRITRDYSRSKASEEKAHPEIELSDATSNPEESLGQYLKTLREDLGLTLKDISARTKIRSTYLENIELENYSQLPAAVYLRGFIVEFARVLSIEDPEGLAGRYLEVIRALEDEEED
ncbi:MAG: helix-turn-helix domain-containing protein [bacterium]